MLHVEPSMLVNARSIALLAETKSLVGNKGRVTIV